jgi:hypothetical protein
VRTSRRHRKTLAMNLLHLLYLFTALRFMGRAKHVDDKRLVFVTCVCTVI